jgi:hypothetical protein
MSSINAGPDKGSNYVICNLTMQQEIEASTIYTGQSTVSDCVQISQQLITNRTSFTAKEIPVNLVSNLLTWSSYHL